MDEDMNDDEIKEAVDRLLRYCDIPENPDVNRDPTDRLIPSRRSSTAPEYSQRGTDEADEHTASQSAVDSNSAAAQRSKRRSNLTLQAAFDNPRSTQQAGDPENEALEEPATPAPKGKRKSRTAQARTEAELTIDGTSRLNTRAPISAANQEDVQRSRAGRTLKKTVKAAEMEREKGRKKT